MITGSGSRSLPAHSFSGLDGVNSKSAAQNASSRSALWCRHVVLALHRRDPPANKPGPSNKRDDAWKVLKCQRVAAVTAASMSSGSLRVE
jgi:hypothetical protein